MIIHIILVAEFWKQIPPNEPYRVILGELRDKLYQTRERSRQLLSHGISETPEEATFTNVEQVSYLWFPVFNPFNCKCIIT
jgi:hypothetical protein